VFRQPMKRFTIRDAKIPFKQRPPVARAAIGVVCSGDLFERAKGL
jgi:hypothetical protein